MEVPDPDMDSSPASDEPPLSLVPPVLVKVVPEADAVVPVVSSPHALVTSDNVDKSIKLRLHITLRS
jgi:hypothetical protein